jgi:capsule polysaccharide export protein KpsE/RkpR
LLSGLLAFLIPPRYESVVRLMPPDQSNGMGSAMMSILAAKGGDGLSSLAGNMLNLKNSGALVIGILTSDTVRNDIINQFDLRRTYWRKRYEDARKVLAKRTDISEDRKSGIVTIRVEDSDPGRAQQIAQAYVDQLNAKVSELTTSSAHRERLFLEERLVEVGRRLDESSLTLSRFSSSNKTFDPATQGKAMLETVAQVQGQLVAAQSEVKGLEQIYGPQNSRVRSANARVLELRNKLQEITGDGTLSGELRAGQLYPSVQQLPILGNTYISLYRRAKIDEAVYEILTKQYELAKVEEAKEIPTIKVLDAAQVPERRSWPPRMLIVILGTLTFCFFAMTLVVTEFLATQMEVHDPRRRAIERVLRFIPIAKHRSAAATVNTTI